ncbi:bifunctional DNA-binding transcriptional regulator/O6-methylguanine-DNA methyltransferase Ada [Parvularcula sp. IMCC14364]|uniref:bifunctional DNA-binding transcriptional regulator/O6-methylguanine-DNA methyltransferase Ada n=1 Tax=Parvularcula sp. IMCC14364 TaxID=3067902 RepID=UPI002741DC9F|nr:bifunctional DNA-binding transcriptional regulator/O6-methylguanine-DNA methyltransferase Ada [Parvularcula sp. IMCC14364]
MNGSRFDCDEMRWQAFVTRNKQAEGAFWIAVKTTGIYCRPGCPARTPNRENVEFYASRGAARASGFRPCRRCKPDAPSLLERQASTVAAAAKIIAEAKSPPTLAALSTAVGMSAHHLHRLFKRHLGVTPRQYADSLRARRLRSALARQDRVTDAIYDAGFTSPSRMYAQAQSRLGMPPRQALNQGKGEDIRYTLAKSWLGRTLVAATDKGICAVQFGKSNATLLAELQGRFPGANLTKAEPGSPYEQWVSETLAVIDAPASSPSMPLDVRGTAFQEQVWRALMHVPSGSTQSYSDIAAEIGKPSAVRAVATACGANKLAVIIPCHRIVSKAGSLSGYRWGLDRKQKLLNKESG